MAVRIWRMGAVMWRASQKQTSPAMRKTTAARMNWVSKVERAVHRRRTRPGGAHDQDVAAASGADGSAGDRFSAVRNDNPGLVGLQRGLCEGFGFGRGGLREDLLTFVVEEVGLGVQGGVEGFKRRSESAPMP